MTDSVFPRLDACWRHPAAYWPMLAIIAAATSLSFAPYYHFWLMPLLFGAFIRLLELRPERQLRSAWLFGLIAYTGQFYWIHTALHDVSGLPNLYAVPLTLLLPAYLALFPLLAVWLWRHTHLPRAFKTGLALPIYWALAEFARERLLTGFGWGALGYSQIADSSPLAGYAPLAGIHLVTLMTAFTGAWLLLIINNRQIRQRLAAAGLLVLSLIIGHFAKQTEYTQTTGQKSSVALAQGNIEQTLKFREDQFMPTLERYFNQVAQSRADIIILPETAIPAIRQQLPPEILQQFAAQARTNGSALAIGMMQFTPDGQNYQNIMLNLSTPDSLDSAPFYAKHHLVPFGEYKPLPALTAPLYRLMDMPLADQQPGGSAQAPFQLANQQVAFNICYEDGFGDELINPARQATLLANASNLAWYGQSNAMYQHLQQSQARSLELGRYMVRATNTGATAIIDPKGRITREAPANQALVLEGEIEGRHGETPYMKLGSSWPLIALLAACAAGLLFAGRRPHSLPDKEKQP